MECEKGKGLASQIMTKPACANGTVLQIYNFLVGLVRFVAFRIKGPAVGIACNRSIFIDRKRVPGKEAQSTKRISDRPSHRP